MPAEPSLLIVLTPETSGFLALRRQHRPQRRRLAGPQAESHSQARSSQYMLQRHQLYSGPCA